MDKVTVLADKLRAETEQFGVRNGRNFKGQTEVPAHERPELEELATTATEYHS